MRYVTDRGGERIRAIYPRCVEYITARIRG
jgi:hypothetical protein